MTTVNNYKSVYSGTSDYLNTPQAQNISSPTSISSATLNTLNSQISSVNNDLASVVSKTQKDGLSGDTAALSSDTAQISSDYAKLSSLLTQVSSASASLSPADAQTEAGFLADAEQTATLANGAMQWGTITPGINAAMSTFTKLDASFSSVTRTLQSNTAPVSTNSNSNISTLLPTEPVTYNWDEMAKLAGG